jgi:acetolactate synthase-1/2/3 large subunit
VIRSGNEPGLRALAGMTGAPVVNTWGAKGVLRWDDPQHAGTAGLQADDFDLAGLRDIDVLITTGLDPDEVTSEPWAGRAEVIDVPPHQLAFAAGSWPVPHRSPQRTALYERVSAVVGPLYQSDQVPLTAPRAAADLAAALPAGGVVAADPGPVGFWIARAFPTTEPGSVIVPARRTPGLAAAAAVAARRNDRPSILVTDDPDDPVTVAVLDHGRAQGVVVHVVVWSAAAALRSAEQHLELVDAAFRADGPDRTDVPVDADAPGPLGAVAGNIVAWAGDRG